MFIKLLIQFMILLLIFFDARGQASSEFSFLEIAKENAINSYLKSMGVNSYLLYNGSGYLPYKSVSGEHPYYYVNWEIGTINYDGQVYINVFLLYDISTDQVITKTFTGEYFQLTKPFINSFTLGDHKFFNLKDSSIYPGIYELLYDNKIKVYCKNEKELHQSKLDHQAHSQSLQRDFKEKSILILYKEGKFIDAKSKQSLLEAFSDHAQEVRRFVREKKLNFKRAAFQTSLIQLVTFYEQLP